MSTQENKPVVRIGEPEVIQDGDIYRFTLHWKDFSHDVDTRIPEGRLRPGYARLMESFNRGLDRFHSKIRDFRRESSKEDEIRQV